MADQRVTEAGDRRVLENGSDVRVLEAFQIAVMQFIARMRRTK